MWHPLALSLPVNTRLLQRRPPWKRGNIVCIIIHANLRTNNVHEMIYARIMAPGQYLTPIIYVSSGYCTFLLLFLFPSTLPFILQLSLVGATNEEFYKIGSLQFDRSVYRVCGIFKQLLSDVYLANDSFVREAEENGISLLSLMRIVIRNRQYETSTFAIALVSTDVQTSSFSYIHVLQGTLPARNHPRTPSVYTIYFGNNLIVTSLCIVHAI